MSRTKLLCNVSTKEYFRLTDDENDTTLYPQIWYRTGYFVKRDGHKKHECNQQNGEKNISFINATRRVYPLDEAEAEEIRMAMADAARACDEKKSERKVIGNDGTT